jgi:hypothetical protein
MENKSFVVIQTAGPFFNAEDVNVLAKRIVSIKEGNSEYLIVNDSGKNVTKKYINDYPNKEHEIKERLIKYSEERNESQETVENHRIVEKNRYRVTSWKKEIDEFYKEKRLISQTTRDKQGLLTNPPPEDEIRDNFISETKKFYEDKNYEKIINHIKVNEYIIYLPEDII